MGSLVKWNWFSLENWGVKVMISVVEHFFVEAFNG